MRDFRSWIEKGLMYGTAWKMLKEQFRQPSTTARALVSQRKGKKIGCNDRRALRELSLDLVNCIATMHQVKYFADINAMIIGRINLHSFIFPTNLVRQHFFVLTGVFYPGYQRPGCYKGGTKGPLAT